MRFVPPQSWFSQVSYGRLHLTVTPLLQWLHMPQGSESYGVTRVVSFQDPSLFEVFHLSPVIL